MEQKEGTSQNVGHEREGFSKRRLSSILKAPRMSMKVCVNEQDENQDETRPIEKRRNSRRVSFATTSNVRVFPKELKAEPVLAPIQNLAVGATGGQNERAQSFDTSVKHDLTGLDTMSTHPIQFELNKENFFPDPSLPVDRTVLLGEDTGYMDMTYSHTVLLEKEEVLYPEFTLNMSSIQSEKLNIPTGLPSQTINRVENSVMQSQFDDFLASLSKAGAQNVSKKINEPLGKENVPASRLTEAEHLERDDMDITDIHPVMNEEPFQQFPYTVAGTHRSGDTTSYTKYLDDMELTRNQTHTLNLKPSVNVNLSMPDPDQRKCTFVCDDPSEMILTEVLDEYVQEQEQLSEHNPFQSSTSFTPVARSDQKMVSGLQTPVSKTKDGSKISMSLAADDQGDLMELTCQASTEVLSRIHDRSTFSVRSNVAVGSKRYSETCAMASKAEPSSVSQLTDPGKNVKRVGPSHMVVKGLEIRHRTVCDDTNRTHLTACGNMDLTRRTICEDMDLTGRTVCEDMDLTGRTVRGDMDLTRRTVCEDMDLTGRTVCEDMDLTGRTVRGDMDLTRRTVCEDMDLTGRTVCGDMDLTGRTVRGDMDLTRRTVCEDMDLTGRTVCEDMDLTGRMVCGDMDLMRRTVCEDMDLTRPTGCGDMDMTLCQTVGEIRSCDNYRPSGTLKKRLSLVSTSFQTGLSLTPEHAGRMDLSSSFPKRMKTENCLDPAAHRILYQDVSNRMEPQQGTAYDMTVMQDDMELTGLTTIDTSPSNKTSSTSRVTSFRTTAHQLRRSEATLEKPGTGFASQTGCRSLISVMDLDAENLKDVAKDQTTDNHKNLIPGQAEELSEEDSNMAITSVFTVPLESQCVAYTQDETARETMETTPVTTEQKISKEYDSDPLKTERSISAKNRRRSLADLQAKLKNISQSIRESEALSVGSLTAPLVSFATVSPVQNHSEVQNSLQSSQETRPHGNRINIPPKEATTPFNLKNSLMARLSVSGIMPKFPPRAGSVHSNQTELKSPDVLQEFPPQMIFDAIAPKNSSYEINLIDEVLPEDDFSGTLVSCLVSQSKTQDVNTGALVNADAIEYDHTNVNQTEKMPPELKEATIKYSSEESQDTDFAAPNTSPHAVKVPDDTSSSSNTSAMKFEGISELSLKNSQLDSQIGDTVDDELDFYKKLEDGSVTVNEFLTYFGAKFVIHRSRPSALPDNFRATQTYTMEDLLREKYIHRPKQKVYETDCQHLSELAEGFKTQMADQDKPLRSFNGTLIQDIGAFSKDQLQRFGSKLKVHRGFFRKRNKALSHKMKEHLYAELLKTTQEAKQSLTSKLKETNEMLNDLDGCINDLESELDQMNIIITGAQRSLIEPEPALKAKQEQLEALNSEVIENEKQICKLELQAQSLEDTWEKVEDETRKLEYHTTKLNSLNEWRVSTKDENRTVFSFLHDTVRLEVQHQRTSGKECMQNAAAEDADISFQFLLNDNSHPSAVLVHKLLTENINRHCAWKERYSAAQSLPTLLHDVSVVVSRLRLLGEEIHRMKRWGGLRLGILHINCVDTVVDVMFSSTRAFVKFEFSLAVTPDYPFRPLQLQKFQNHIGDTRLEQIKDIISSVRPAQDYLTTVMKRIHSNLLS